MESKAGFVRGICRRCCGWLGRKRVRFLFLLILLGVALFCLIGSGLGPKTWKFDYLRNLNRPHRRRKDCPLTKVEVFGHQMMSLMNLTVFMSGQLNCSKHSKLGIFKKAAFHVEKGYILVREIKFPEDVKCCFQEVTRVGDEEVRVDEKCNEIDVDKESTAIPPPTETISVTCKTSKNEVYYKDGFQIFHLKPQLEKRIRRWQEDEENRNGARHERLSVIIISMDTVSQAHFVRAMPETNSYLDTKLSDQVVKILGYNKVGANSDANSFAILTGMTTFEFAEVCIKRKNATDPKNQTRIDTQDCPFLWNTFASQGYRTLFAEDYQSISIFNFYYYGFPDEAPTDYYWRPLSLLMEKVFGYTDRCYGPRSSYTALLDAVKQMADLFNVKDSTSNRHFSFMHSNWLGHNRMDMVRFGDKPTLAFLQYLHEKGHLNHTALFLVGDHGWRSNNDVEQAMIENRMPLGYIVLPPWFGRRYSQPFRNLQRNAEKSVASQFDMHKTILDILDLARFEGDNWRENRHFSRYSSRDMGNRGQSLFEWNPDGRDCESAGIPWMWCLCYKTIPLRNDSLLAVTGAQAVIDAVNEKVAKFTHLCEKLHLRHVVNAWLLIVNEDTWKKPECQQVIDSNSNSIPGHNQNKPTMKMNMSVSNLCEESIHIRISLVGSPSEPNFKTVAVRSPTQGFSVPDKMVREDWYSAKGHCIADRHLKPYCICKDVANSV